jgi:hypothetical protein
MARCRRGHAPLRVAQASSDTGKGK